MEDPDGPAGRNRALFVDRVSEAEALRRALAQHRTRIDSDVIDSQALRNVLVFYGEGGVGKTELSRQLGDWVLGHDALSADWGPSPVTNVDAVARWDVHDSRGDLDPLALLIGLRTQLGTIQRTWPAFDLAFAAFHTTLRPGVDLRLRAPRAGSTTLSEVLGGLTGDVIAAAGMAATGGLSAGVTNAGRSLLSKIRARSAASKAIREYPTLERLIDDCEAMSTGIEETARLAGRVAFMLTLQTERMSPPERPLTVVFVDHMERLQMSGERHLGEAALNRLVSRLPYLLFVVTGRKSLRWYEPMPELPASGANTWPLLSPLVDSAEEPRQHLIGNLSLPDAVTFLTASFEALSIVVEPGLAAQLATNTDGWPLHLQTIVGVAAERFNRAQPLDVDDLGGKLPALVERLLSDLPASVADAFRAACLLPYFDVAFVVAAGEVRAGDVEQLLQRQIVRPNVGSVYPYRIHDTMRRLVRETGSAAVAGWAALDWDRHARLALAESERRFEQAMEVSDDSAAIQSLALGLNVATENGVYEPWLMSAIRRSPTIQGLGALVSAEPDPSTPRDLADVLDFVYLRDRALQEDVTEALHELVVSRTAVASTAGLWRAYDLRRMGRVDEALAQLQQLVEDFGDRLPLYQMQIVTTLRLDRRYLDALALVPELTDVQQRSEMNAILRAHGTLRRSDPEY